MPVSELAPAAGAAAAAAEAAGAAAAAAEAAGAAAAAAEAAGAEAAPAEAVGATAPPTEPELVGALTAGFGSVVAGCRGFAAESVPDVEVGLGKVGFIGATVVGEAVLKVRVPDVGADALAG